MTTDNTRMRIRALTLLIVAALALSPAARSQALTDTGTAAVGDDGFSDRLARFATGLLETLGLADFVVDRFIAPAGAAGGNASLTSEFSRLMDVAGYKIKEIESSVGIIPDISLTFGQARELTEGDRNYLERQLARHAVRHPGLLGMAQRAIVRAVADASELGNFEVEKVEVTLLPLPKVKLVLSPSGAPLSPEAARIMRAIDRLGSRANDPALPARD